MSDSRAVCLMQWDLFWWSELCWTHRPCSSRFEKHLARQSHLIFWTVIALVNHRQWEQVRILITVVFVEKTGIQTGSGTHRACPFSSRRFSPACLGIHLPHWRTDQPCRVEQTSSSGQLRSFCTRSCCVRASRSRSTPSVSLTCHFCPCLYPSCRLCPYRAATSPWDPNLQAPSTSAWLGGSWSLPCEPDRTSSGVMTAVSSTERAHRHTGTFVEQQAWCFLTLCHLTVPRRPSPCSPIDRLSAPGFQLSLAPRGLEAFLGIVTEDGAQTLCTAVSTPRNRTLRKLVWPPAVPFLCRSKQARRTIVSKVVSPAPSYSCCQRTQDLPHLIPLVSATWLLSGWTLQGNSRIRNSTGTRACLQADRSRQRLHWTCAVVSSTCHPCLHMSVRLRSLAVTLHLWLSLLILDHLLDFDFSADIAGSGDHQPDSFETRPMALRPYSHLLQVMSPKRPTIPTTWKSVLRSSSSQASRPSTTLATTARSPHTLRLTTSTSGMRWLHHCTSRREANASLRQTYHSNEESLFPSAQSISASTERPVQKRMSSQS